MSKKPAKKSTNEKRDNCFIIMPITTPPDFLSSYGNDDSHFKHVLDCLFIPAIERVGLSAIPPVAKGAELIQSRTIKYIEEAPLVLCDISTLNPNVFFELGIRTALNKPLCLVMDDITEKIPFDTGVINHHKYKYSLPAWEIEEEIKKLHKHIVDSRKTSATENELWKHFGISSIAEPSKEKTGTPEILKYLTLQIESMRKDLYAQKEARGAFTFGERAERVRDYASNRERILRDMVAHSRRFTAVDINTLEDNPLMEFLDRLKTKFRRMEVDPISKGIIIYLENNPSSDNEILLLQEEASKFGYHLVVK